jgi:hypothetical protein
VSLRIELIVWGYVDEKLEDSCGTMMILKKEVQECEAKRMGLHGHLMEGALWLVAGAAVNRNAGKQTIMRHTRPPTGCLTQDWATPVVI